LEDNELNILKQYGLNERFATEAAMYPDFQTGRVISQYNGLYKVITEGGELLAEISGKYRYEAHTLEDYPAVGDFVMLDRAGSAQNTGIIHKCLTRKSSFNRKAAGIKNETQVVAANIDTVFICMSLNSDYNLRRLERYLSIAWDSRAVPVVILTKADLCGDAEQKLAELASVAIGVDTIVTSYIDPLSCEKVRAYLSEGKTASFIGSSGAGKSTLINRLAGKELFATGEIRGDGKGRHTTTRRELVLLPQGGIVIDTPGMRELGIESADLSKAFSDIDELSERCRFRDCSHKNEPGCAVKAAVDAGILGERRLESYFKLEKEAGYEGLNSKQIETQKINTMFAGVGGIKNARKLAQEKHRQKP